MDKSFRNIDFDKVDEAVKDKFDDDWTNIDDEIETCSEKELVEFIKSFGSKLKQYHPIRNSDGHGIMESIWKAIERGLRDRFESEPQKIAENILYLIDCLIESGWTAATSEFMVDFAHAIPDKYFESITNDQLKQIISKIDKIDYHVSPMDKEDDHSFTVSHMKDGISSLFYDNFEPEFINANTEVFLDLDFHFIMNAWSTELYIVEACDWLSYYLNRKFDKPYLKAKEKYVEIMKKVAEKTINEKITTEKGVNFVSDYIRRMSDMNKDKDTIAGALEHWITMAHALSKLKNELMQPLEKTLFANIRDIDKTVLKDAYKKTDNLIQPAVEITMYLLDSFPTYKTEEEKESRDSRNKKDQWKHNLQSFFNNFFVHAIQNVDQFKLIIPCFLKLIEMNKGVSKDIFNRGLSDFDKKFVSFFKADPLIAIPFIDQFVAVAKIVGETENHDEEFPFSREIRDLSDPYREFTDNAKQGKAFNSPEVQKVLFKHILDLYDNYTLAGTAFLTEFVEFVTIKNLTPDDSLAYLKSLKAAVSCDTFKILNFNAFRMGDLTKSVIEAMNKNCKKHAQSYDMMFQCLMELKDHDLELEFNGENRDTASILLVLHILQGSLATKTTDEIMARFVPVGLEVIFKTLDNEGVGTCFPNFVTMAPSSMTNPSLLGPYIGEFVKLIIKLKEDDRTAEIMQFLMSINTIVGKDPDLIKDHVKTIEDIFIELYEDETLLYFFVEIFTKVYKNNPEKFRTDLLEKLMELVDNRTMQSATIFNLFIPVSNGNGAIFVQYLDILLSSLKEQKIMVAYGSLEVFNEIIKVDKAASEKIFNSLVSMVDEDIENTMFLNMLLSHLRIFGLYNHPLLCTIKTKVEKWQSTNSGLHDTCQHLLDVIADRSLAGLEKEIGKQEEKIADVNVRVDDTNERVDQVEKDVEEVDQKTLSNAPKWAREVSLLLNPESDKDWRLLASRLGYSNDEIRDWSTHADPCMSLLSDWFAVRRNIEATRAVLEQLTEMDRLDAASIVEKALTAAEAVVSDEDPVEFSEPPPIFLSYQWANQEEVKVLRQHLERAGYRCWMDIGQMGGGDKLYEAIDRGIRGATVLVACVTSKYAESANCKRELNLAINLRKAVIPLQMERMDWPPPGTMGPLLTEYIFIRMFAKPGVQIVEGTFWPADRFQELLMQIRYSCAPDYDTVHETYANWWEPPEVKIEYKAPAPKQNQDQQQTQKPKEKNPEDSNSPPVFLSYQWGKQNEIKSLHSYLQHNIGVASWMDIYQMGGGDSLYDKIDKGIRGCQVIVACVTSKYTESPNCRKEVSLADGIKKPLIPIKLEHIDWPPSGPMAMALAPLTPIDLVDEQGQWNGPNTEELVERILKHLPEKYKLNTPKKTEVPQEKPTEQPEKKIERTIKQDDRKKSLPEPVIQKEPIQKLPPITIENGTDKMTQAVHIKSTQNNTNFKQNPEIAKSKTCVIL